MEREGSYIPLILKKAGIYFCRFHVAPEQQKSFFPRY